MCGIFLYMYYNSHLVGIPYLIRSKTQRKDIKCLKYLMIKRPKLSKFRSCRDLFIYYIYLCSAYTYQTTSPRRVPWEWRSVVKGGGRGPARGLRPSRPGGSTTGGTWGGLSLRPVSFRVTASLCGRGLLWVLLLVTPVNLNVSLTPDRYGLVSVRIRRGREGSR